MFVMSSIAENPKAAMNEEEQTDDLPSKNVGINAVPDPVGTLVWTQAPTDFTLPGVVQCAQHHDPHTFRLQCQPRQGQQQYSDYLRYPQTQQFKLLTGPMTGTRHCSQPGSSSWFTEPILCSTMPAELHTSESNVCVALAMDHQHLEEGLSIDNNHLTHPMLYHGNSSGQLLLMNPDPGPVFPALENTPVHIYDSLCQEEVVATLSQSCSTAAQIGSDNCKDIALGTLNQVVCLSDSSDYTVNIQHQAPTLQTGRTTQEMRSRKPCHCTRSMCLKLYCECFASGVMCSNCNCSNCHNNIEHGEKRGKAIKSCLVRNPDAFRPKIAGGMLGEVKGWHSKGCNCKRSGCLKNYCECYEANIMCTSSCKCVGCRNYDGSSGTSLLDKTEKDNGPGSVITPAVVGAVCGCLLARAEQAEKELHSKAWAQHMILSEFGHCLTQIVVAMFQIHTD